MTFLADENFPRPALLVLREAGNDVRSVAEDCPGSSDEEVADICARDARVLLTFDKDFGELVFRRGLRAGLAIVLFRMVPESPLEVLGMLRSLVETRVLEAGVFCVITRDRVRIRRPQPGDNS
jgi:predicted nuclease of predicted toxin-antitoxin system